MRGRDLPREAKKGLNGWIQDVLLFTRGESIGRDVIPVVSLIADAVQTVEPLCCEKGWRFWSRRGWQSYNHGQPKGVGRRASESAGECLAGM